jgi:outer membrane protein assembly factor BamD
MMQETTGTQRLLGGLLGLILCTGLLVLGGCAGKEKPSTPEEYLRLGNRQLSQKRQQQARQYYQELLENFPESTYKAEAQFNIAESLYGEENYVEARFEYSKFLELYPAHPLASRAQFQLGMCSLQQILSFDRDQTHTRQALQDFRLLRRKYPQDPLVSQAEAHIRELRARLATRELYVARFYYKKKAYQAAIGRLLNLIQVYPTTPDLDEALYMLAESYRAEENYVKAQRVLRLLVDRFPQSKYVSRARTQLRRPPETGIAIQ